MRNLSVFSSAALAMVVLVGLGAGCGGGAQVVSIDVPSDAAAPEARLTDGPGETNGLDVLRFVDARTGEADVFPWKETATDFDVDAAADAPGPQCEPGQGCFLDPCSDNAECLSGWCVEHIGEGVCTIPCQEECPPGWTCKQVAGTEPDVVFLCVSEFANLCRPCAGQADCKSAGGMEDACVDYGSAGSFCGGQCEDGLECPWGFSCKPSLTVDGIETTSCVADAGVCSCSGKSIALSLWTPCNVTNDFGTCSGKRVCVEGGLSACDAPEPTLEACNAADDDCDGETDEPSLIEGEYIPLCDDGNLCTKDSCKGTEGCQAAPLSEVACDDADACTADDVCIDGTCSGEAIDCNDSNLCTDDSCDAAFGCVNDYNWAACDDSDPCTAGDSCKKGACSGEPIPCECTTDPDCEKLEDGDLCNGTLACDVVAIPHQCVVVPDTIVKCPAPEGLGSECQVAACAPNTGECGLLPGPDGKACDDGDACTYAETCQGGQCLPGKTLTCNDGNPCTNDVCEPAAGCTHSPNTSDCDDSNVCTVGDSCAEGTCLPGLDTLACDDGNVCTADDCSPAAGCTHSPVNASCDDGNWCTVGDACVNGSCGAGTQALNCDDGNPCTDDSCNPELGCSHAPNTAGCDDSDACTVGDVCNLGSCAPGGKTLVCDDANPCTNDTCVPATGCQHVVNQEPCSDWNECTVGDECTNGICLPGPEWLDCSDGNPCTDDGCMPASGCYHKVNTVPCEDGSPCTSGETCSAGKCGGGVPVNCDDGNSCTKDMCDPGAGCVHLQKSCDDCCPACHIEVCDPASGSIKCLDGCDDDDACTMDWCEPQTELCTYTAVDCDDGNPCTDDSCDPQSGCRHDPNAAGCDDSDPCTVGDACAGGTCKPGPALPCDDGNPCTKDQCSTGGVCLHQWAGPCTVQPGPADGMDHVIGSVYNIDPNGTMDHIRTGGWGDNYWALLQFPLNSLPPQAKTATIRLFGMNDNISPTNMYLDRVTSQWAENCTWSQKPSYVNVTTIPPSQVGVWYEIVVTDLYNGWRAGTWPNYGVQFRSYGTWNNYNGFWSSDYTDDPTLRPILVVVPVDQP